MRSKSKTASNLIIAGIAIILQDVTSEELDTIKANIETITGAPLYLHNFNTQDMPLPSSFEKLVVPAKLESPDIARVPTNDM